MGKQPRRRLRPDPGRPILHQLTFMFDLKPSGIPGRLFHYNPFIPEVDSMRIRNFVLISVIALAAFSAGSAQEPIKPSLNPRIITATRQVTIFNGLENQLLRAVQSKDQAGLSKLV